MPGMGGEEAFRELQRINRGIPVIMTSGYTRQELNRHFPDDGPTAFIQKPYRLQSLRNALRGALENGAQQPD